MTKPARERILDAAHELWRGIGLARTTTKEIARAADCSEAALYKFYGSKEELFVAVLRERLPRLGPLLERLTADPGGRTVEENLTDVARHAALFYAESFPIGASLYAEPRLKERHDAVLRELGAGPHQPVEALTRYLTAERDAGRLRPGADPSAAASLLLGACVHRAFAYEATPAGRPPQGLDAFAASLARTLLAGIGPDAGDAAG
ncbi:TetR/AcrR family transcriptional regulator [Streptomyces lichenis]|uniref:TetR/AcrR family transcriptional regulator n=1 Tax=Streptomyces lichenis TaxID=2306967 RepID=A0ABT0IG50_9ACTN|nr:TetR/AcrR family transcriptional regulator [Streptomyces lichenis]MCK8680299.1 TetR/AcrR family transcriptional regulator [Streptomyces lichenis]